MNNKITLPEHGRLVDGVFHQVLHPHTLASKRPALFLDRDGCVVVEVQYLHKVADVELIPGASQVIARANALNIAVVFVTNQAGIGRGYFDWPDFFLVQKEILAQLAKGGAQVDAVYACPFHATVKPPYNHPDHPSRKPNAGMLLAAAADLNLDLAHSWIAGDRAGDVQAGLNAGLAGGLHVATGHGMKAGERDAARGLETDKFQVLIADSIAQAPELIELFS